VTTFRPINDRILIKPDRAPEKTAGGLWIPDNAREKDKELRTGIVIGMGEGMKTRRGTRWPMPDGQRPDILPDLRPRRENGKMIGRRVHYYVVSGACTEMKIDGVLHHVVRDDALDLWDDADVVIENPPSEEAITRTLLESEPAMGGV
jgi:hypothetical protein